MSVYKIQITVISFMLCVIVSYQQQCSIKVVTDLTQKNCTDKANNETTYYLDKGQCIPKCKEYPKVETNTDCTNNPDRCIAGYECQKRCGPKSEHMVYTCETEADCKAKTAAFRVNCNKYCILPTIHDDSEGVMCMAYHSNMPAFEGKWWTAKKFKPVCDDQGVWKAKQCKGGIQGRCMCYSSIGVRIFGEAHYKDSENMTCACSRKKNDLESAGRTYVTVHCDNMGNYEEFQCDIEKEICWCTDPKTGEPTAPFVPEKAKKKLPCYLAGKEGSQYLRQCESKKLASEIIASKLKSHGIKTMQMDTLLCDADGSFGAYSVANGIGYCTWRDNTKLEPWQANLAGLKEKLTCRCARDYKMYGHSLKCEGSGNYIVLQSYVTAEGKKKYYCLDEDGFPKTDLLDDPLTQCSEFY